MRERRTVLGSCATGNRQTAAQGCRSGTEAHVSAALRKLVRQMRGRQCGTMRAWVNERVRVSGR